MDGRGSSGAQRPSHRAASPAGCILGPRTVSYRHLRSSSMLCLFFSLVWLSTYCSENARGRK